MQETPTSKTVSQEEIQDVAHSIAYFTRNILPKLSGNFKIDMRFTLAQLFHTECTNFTYENLLSIKYGINWIPSNFSWDEYVKLKAEQIIKQQEISDMTEYDTNIVKILATRDLETFQRIKQLSLKPRFIQQKDFLDILDSNPSPGKELARKILNMINDCLDDIAFLRRETDNLILSDNKVVSLDKLEKILYELGNTISTLSKKPQNQEIIANGMRKGLRNLLQDFYGTNSIELLDLP